MTIPQTAPFGAWRSPITSDLITAKTIGLTQFAPADADTFWIEMRPEEGGRYVIVRRDAAGQISDILPPPYNARTRVHEYGGAAMVVHQGVIYFSHFADQRLYRLVRGQEPQALTPETAWRYADGVVDAARNRLICVREDHTTSDQEAVNTVAAIDLADGARQTVLTAGYDFYAAPRLSPDGSRLAWLSWNHPNMPWDGTELWVAEIAADGTLQEAQKVAGGPAESIFQPAWSPNGVLHFVSDRSDWWNLCRWREGQVEALAEMEAEFGAPAWNFGGATYDFITPSRLICTYNQQGTWHLAELNTVTGSLTPIPTPYTIIGNPIVERERVIFTAGSPTAARALVQLDLQTHELEILRRTADLSIDEGYISLAEPIEFPTENGLTAHAFFYRPKNRDYASPEGEKPPLLVMSHGGPTGATSAGLNLAIQYWTSRGIAVVDVNYGGSTGYGRPYRQRLNGRWGIVDVDDCVNAARYLTERGLVDGQRLAIRGGSAGGYTTLSALTFRDVFQAGASHFGISDLAALARETHKFESRYLDNLIGPYPEREDIYRERSPIYHAEQLNCPVIFFQGLEDAVVPPSQAELMVDVLREKGVPVAYVPFAGEQHGFRRAENIRRALDGELYFYSRIFGFEPAEAIEPVPIENLD